MKTGLKRIMSILLALTMVLTMTGVTVLATETESLPTALEAPDIIVYDSGSRNINLEVKVQHPTSVLDVYEKGYINQWYDQETYSYYSDYGDHRLYAAHYQVDWKIDNGDWQYTADWDNSYYAGGSASSFNGQQVDSCTIGYVTTYYKDTLGQALLDGGCLIETTDGSSTYYRFDTENHSLSVRVRYFFTFAGADYSNMPKVFSDWSETAVYGAGNVQENNIPMTLSAPVIANLEIYDYSTYSGYPYVRFDSYPGADILSAMMWYEEYDAALEDSSFEMVLEASLDPAFGEGAVVVDRTVYESSASKRRIDWSDMFYDLWYELPTSDQEAFVWNGETVYLRAKWVNDREISGEYSEIESPYSNVLSIAGPTITSYCVTVNRDSAYFDSDSGYRDAQYTYQVTEGMKYDSVYCYPVEGCFVATVTINGTVMYDKEDEATYELLDWWSNYTAFELLEEDNVATKDLTIEITYGGTPTAQWGITTECGNGGYLYCNTNYVSWEDNSLVVYQGTAPRIYIDPNDGFVIESVTIDGVENEQAKADGYYDFPAITDNTHSIAVTFKREAYYITYYAGANGYIQSDYEWWSDTNRYVAIGDDVTFTFGPNADESGKYYEITEVWIDGVLNEEAKAAGSYTFANVQAAHSIYVYFSTDPVTTHDVTATSGENGSISPEGIVHVREGSDKYFYFYPDEGYEVDKVFVDDVEITNLATKEYYIVSDVTAEHTIHVTFKKLPVKYDVSVVVSGHNTSAHGVSPVGTTPVQNGESFTVTFTPFAGYYVEKILVNGSAVEADGSYSIAAVNADTTIEIFFKIKSYTVTFVDHDGTELKKETVEHGAKATAPSDPVREHYVFTGWDTTFSDVTTSVTIRATYRPAEYTVKFIGWDGSVLKTETVSYNANAIAPEAPEREGYDFSHWSHSFVGVSSNLDVTAVYEKKEYTVTFVDSDDTVLSTQTVKHGEAATAPEAPTREGYTFIGWDNTNYSHVTQAMTVKAMYVEGIAVTYTVTARALGNTGTVSPAGVSTVLENSSLTLIFTPDELSKIVRVVVDGIDIEVCSSYTFPGITANHTIDVYFAPTAVIHVGNIDTAQGTASGHYDLIDGEMVYILDVTPTEGYALDGIFVDGVMLELEVIDGNYIIRDLTDDMSLDIRFKSIPTDNEDGGNTGSDDPVEEIPKTGNNSHLALWFALMAISALSVLFIVNKRKVMN